MTSVAVLGAGAGGAATAVDLTRAGHDVALWSRSRATIAPLRTGGVSFDGALGAGKVMLARVTDDLDEALDGAELTVVCLPAPGHPPLGRALAERAYDRPIVLNPGGTCGALLLRAAFIDAGKHVPPIAELSTLTYIARKIEPGCVSIYTVTQNVHAACLPGGSAALDGAHSLFRGVLTDPHVLSTSLRNVNLVLHPPIALLAAAWVEATAGGFLVYAQGVTPGTFRLMQALDSERLSLARAAGVELPGLVEEMVALGSADRDSFERGLPRQAIARGEANSSIRAPDSLEHRYYREDFSYGVVPFCELARIFDVPTPVAGSMLTVASAVLGSDARAAGLTAARLGLEGLGPRDVLELVGGAGS